MRVIPAVDIMQGKCVRLVRGDPAKSKVYFDDPFEAARLFEDQGAKCIHLIDLDAALGTGQNMIPVRKIITGLKVEVEVGGGVRTFEKAQSLLELGASRVIFGTAALQDPALIEHAVCSCGSERIAVAIDEREDKATLHGWKYQSEMNYLDSARMFEKSRVGTMIFTSVSVDGTLNGPSVKKIINLVKTVKVPIVASGGVSSLNDLVALTRTGAVGAVIGTALYERKFTLEQALETVEKC